MKCNCRIWLKCSCIIYIMHYMFDVTYRYKTATIQKIKLWKCSGITFFLTANMNKLNTDTNPLQRVGWAMTSGS